MADNHHPEEMLYATALQGSARRGHLELNNWSKESFARASEVTQETEAEFRLIARLERAELFGWVEGFPSNPLNVPESLKSSYLVNSIKNLYDYRMFLPEGSDDREIKCLELLVESGVQREQALALIPALKAIWGNASAPPEQRAETAPTQTDHALETGADATMSSGEKERTVAGVPFEEFKAYADQHQWKTRRDRGYSWNADVFGYIRNTYADWIKIGRSNNELVTQADIAAVDVSLYNKLQQELSKRRLSGERLPDFGIPSVKDLPLEEMDDFEASRLAESRQHWRDAKAIRRNLKK